MFDRDNNGFITLDELQRAMQMIGEEVTDAQLNEMLALADLDKDGRINYEGKETQLCSNSILLRFLSSSQFQSLRDCSCKSACEAIIQHSVYQITIATSSCCVFCKRLSVNFISSFY